MANPIAVPGTVVSSGAAVSPGGAQGLAGTPAWTTCTSSFTIPAVGSTVSVPVVDTSWITTGEMIYVDQAGGSGQSGILQVTAKAGNTLTLLNPAPAPAIPPADATQAGLLKQLNGNTTDFVDGTNTCQNLVNAVQPTIWSARLRSFNAVGNPNFEVAQRNVRGALVNPAQATMLEDRWYCGNGGSLNPTFQGLQAGLGAGTGVVIPGTNFPITTAYVRITVGTQKTSLAVGDVLHMAQTVDGPRFRELMRDVHSCQLLVRSSVANLKFGLSLRDQGGTQSLTKLCTLGAANTITLIQLPNLPGFPSAGAFTAAVGLIGYSLTICLAAGSNLTNPANDVWQSFNGAGALGQDNFLANAVGSTFEIFFVQHEPGALCTTLQDCPFTQNYDDCLRYYEKSYPYAAAPGTANGAGIIFSLAQASTSPYFPVRFKKVMAKVPTVTGYSYSSGAINTVRDIGAAVDKAISSAANVGDSAFSGFTVTSPNAALWQVGFHYTADTGW